MKFSNKKRVAMRYISGKSMKASPLRRSRGEYLQTESAKHWKLIWIWMDMAFRGWLRFIFACNAYKIKI